MALSFDRDRVRAFGLFAWRRFVADRCFETAGALSYTTLFALVPLTAAVFGILSVLPGLEDLDQRLQHFLFTSFVPAAGHAVQHYLLRFAGNASKLTALGAVVFLLSALAMMFNIEERFNRIWRVTVRRSPVSRFLMYWAALTLGPLLLVGGLTLTSYLSALPLPAGPAGAHWDLTRKLWSVLPFLVTVAGLFAMYTLVPNRRVPARHAVVGAVLSALLFEFARWAFGAYVQTAPSYQEIYGQLAVIPIFLVWVFLSWVIVLLGASITASLSAFEYRPRHHCLPDGGEFLGFMHVLKHLVRAQREGRGLSGQTLLHCEHFMTDDLLARYLSDMENIQLVRRTEDDLWVLVRNLDDVTLARLYVEGRYHLPMDERVLEPLAHDLPPALVEALERLAADLRQGLSPSLSAAFGSDCPPPLPVRERRAS